MKMRNNSNNKNNNMENSNTDSLEEDLENHKTNGTGTKAGAGTEEEGPA